MKEMKKIASFCVDHTKLNEGMYLSRKDGDIITYDIRMRKPNGGDYLSNASIHTIEHLFATYARNSAVGEHIVYVGPMGCRTGFYFLTRNLSDVEALRLVQESFAFISEYQGEIPGTSEVECGNCREHDLNAAKRDAQRFLLILKDYSVEQMDYNWNNQ